MTRSKILATLGVAAAAYFSPAAAQDQTLLLRNPTISDSHLAFVYAGDIWVADRNGANARRLTSHPASESNPTFSPDGSMIAYSGNYDGNVDVYVIRTEGGQPKRLTWHPDNDLVMDWTADGANIAFTSRRETDHRGDGQLFHVSVNGGLPAKRMDARVFRGAYNDDNSKLAYMPHRAAYNGLYGGSSGWRGYRGGTSPSITIMDFNANTAKEIPGERVNDIEPMWLGDQLYFLSDREDKTLNVFHYDPATEQLSKISNEPTWDIRAADAHNGAIIYEAGGRLKELDVASGQTREIRVSISPDLPQLRPQWKDASKTVQSFALSPTGKRVVVTARGDIYTVPVKDGSTRNLTQTDGAREYTGIWSPDGEQIAYIDSSEAVQRLIIVDQAGLNAPRRLTLGDGFHNLLGWSSDGANIVYHNHKLELYAITAGNGARTRIAEHSRRGLGPASFATDISPDGKWLAYAVNRPNFNAQMMLYNFSQKRSWPVGDAMAHAGSPAFSRDGKYLYFTGSTNAGPQQVVLDMSSQEKPYRAAIYAVSLASDTPSPVAPKTGDESGEEDDEEKSNEKNANQPTRVDVNGIERRIVALPVAERNYYDLSVDKKGALYYIQSIQPGAANTPPGENAQAENALMRFDFKKREAKKIADDVTAAIISADGGTILTQNSKTALQVGETGEEPKFEALKMSGVRAFVDPRKEWAQIFDDVWRMEPAFFYDPNLHGLDWDAVYQRYRPLVDHVGRREDLNALLVEMIGEMQAGHNRTGGGDIYQSDAPKAAMLGANIVLENGRHKIARIYDGEQWNPFVKAPLAAPGLNISEGDYILAIDGKTLGPNDNIYEHLQGTAGELATLRIAAQANGRGARDVVVEPIDNERNLRLWRWVEDNRKAVEEATGGRVGYVYLPNTGGGGYTFFNRMFFPQVDKDAMIIDERANGGGQAANYITDVLSRTYLSGWKDSVGQTFNTPGAAMFGPKVMLIDQNAGSGGDFLPYSFREMNIGPLIGKRTWGGLIGISANPPLIDGGFLTVPYFRFFDTNYRWTVENEGVAPDIEVDLDPVASNAGRDTQLERAIAETLRLLETNPSPVPTQAPPYPTELGK